MIDPMEYLPLVKRIAKNYSGMSFTHEDLAQEGFVGLIEAIKKYDPDKGPFAPFATLYVRTSISQLIMRNWSLTPFPKTKNAYKAIRNLHKYRVNDYLSEEQVLKASEELNIPVDEILVIDALYVNSTLSMDAYTSEEGSEYRDSFGDGIRDESTLEDIVHRTRALELIENKTTSVDPKWVEIFNSRLATDDPESLKDIASRLGITPQRVDQLSKAARNRILDNLCLEDFL